jgi:hypothetical protein
VLPSKRLASGRRGGGEGQGRGIAPSPASPRYAGKGAYVDEGDETLDPRYKHSGTTARVQLGQIASDDDGGSAGNPIRRRICSF